MAPVLLKCVCPGDQPRAQRESGKKPASNKHIQHALLTSKATSKQRHQQHMLTRLRNSATSRSPQRRPGS